MKYLQDKALNVYTRLATLTFKLEYILLMKKYYIYHITLFLTIVLVCSNVNAQDYTSWALPDGATARLGKGEITGNIAFSPDGTRLAVATSIGIWIYDARTSETKPIDLLTGHTQSVTSIAFSPNGAILASGSKDATVRLWDVITGLPITVLNGHNYHVSCLAFSPDGNTLASGRAKFNKTGDPIILLWDIPTRELRGTLKLPPGESDGITKSVRCLAFSPDGKTLASMSDYEEPLLWDIYTKQHKTLSTKHNRQIMYVGFSPDGNTFVTGSWDNTVKLWDANSGTHKMTIPDQTIGGIRSVSISPDGNTIAIGDHKSIQLWDANTGKHKITFNDKQSSSIATIAFSLDGNTLAAVGHSDGYQNTLILWDMQTQKHQTTIKGYTPAVKCLTFSPDGNTIATGNSDGIGYLWDLQTKKHIATLKRHKTSINFIEYAPDGNTIVTASRWDNTVQLWDSSNLLSQTHIRMTKKIPITEKTPLIVSMAYTPDGNIIATASGRKAEAGVINLYNAQTGQKITTLKGQELEILYLMFSPDGTILATAHAKQIIQLWNVKTRQIITTLKAQIRFSHGYPTFAFSPNGTLLAAAGIIDNIQIWDTSTHKQKHIMKTPIKDITCIRFSTDNTLIATGHRDGTLLLYHRPTQQYIATFKGHTATINAITFSPHGNTLATASDDGTILVWKIR